MKAATALLALLLVTPLLGQGRPPAGFTVERWPYPSDTTVWQAYEYLFDDFAQGQDSLVQIYLGQSVWWQADSASPWVEWVFDSVQGRGDQREVHILARTETDTIQAHWMGYTTRMLPDLHFIPDFIRGEWHSISQIMPDSTIIQVTYCLHKVVGLGDLSRAQMWFHATRKPIDRWWK